MYRCAAALLALAIALAACAEPPRSRPNLLLLLLDTTRADHLGCYGYARKTSPTLDALAAEGTRFEYAMAQSSLTPVAAGSILTGVLPFRHGVRSLFAVEGQRLAQDVTTLAEALSREGMQTAGIVSALPMGARYGLDRGFALYEDELADAGRANREKGLANPNQRRADASAALALDWLEAHVDEPFFLMLHLFDAHDPTLVPPRAFLEERVSFALPADLDRIGNLAGGVRSAAERVELYDAEIAYMDAQIRSILDLLARRGRLDETLVVVIGDHGEGLGDHGLWAHGSLHEEQLRVPLLLRGPGIPRGRVVASRVRAIDLLPTLSEIYDLPRPVVAPDGHTLLPLLRGEPAPPLEVYAEVHHPHDRPGRERAMYTLSSDGWKYIHRPQSGRHELYDLGNDPAERRNVFHAAHPMAVRLRDRLQALGAVDDYQAPVDAVDEASREALRQLGYLND